MKRNKNLREKLISLGKNENFLLIISKFETIIAKILSLALLIVIIIALADLIVYLVNNIGKYTSDSNKKTVVELFGLFLNILIALELLENITAYLKKHIVQLELVIVTSLIAIARKIIIFDLSKYSNNDLIALSIGILALAVSYWLVKRANQKQP